MNPKENGQVSEIPLEESMLPLIFPVSPIACFEAGMFVSGLFAKPRSAETLLNQEAKIGRVRDAFQAAAAVIELMEDQTEGVRHNFRLGALYSDKAISVDAKEKRVEIPTVHSMDVNSLIAKAREYLAEGGVDGDFAYHNETESLIQNSRQFTGSMSDGEREHFEIGARLIAYCVAEVAAKTAKNFREQLGDRRSAFPIKLKPLTPEQIADLMKKVDEEDTAKK